MILSCIDTAEVILSDWRKYEMHFFLLLRELEVPREKRSEKLNISATDERKWNPFFMLGACFGILGC